MRQGLRKKAKTIEDEQSLEELRQKASFLEELLDFIEDKSLGFLMKETEKEDNLSLSEAKPDKSRKCQSWF